MRTLAGSLLAVLVAACSTPHKPAAPRVTPAPVVVPPPVASVAPIAAEAGAPARAVDLVALPNGADALLVDDKHVYVLGYAPRLGSVPKSGGALTEVIPGVGAMHSWQSLAQSSATVFATFTYMLESPSARFLFNPTIAVAPKNGGKVVERDPSFIASPAYERSGQPGVTIAYFGTVVVGAAADDASVYWLEGTAHDIEISGDRLVTALAGGGALHVIAKHLPNATDLAVAGGTAVLLVQGTGPHQHQGSVLRVSLAGGAPARLAAGLDAPSGLALDATHAYFVDGGRLLRVDISATAPATPDVVVPDIGRSSYAVDATNVYFTTPTGVLRARSDGSGSPQQIASGKVTGPVALDETSVYFVADGALKKIAK